MARPPAHPDTPPDTALLLSEVGARLRQARIAQGMNLHQLARLTGISAPALSLIETGKRDPRLSTLGRVARALRMPLSDVMGHPQPDPDAPAQPAPGDGYDLDAYR
ncbi:XRE family transcriptional regulator [Pseudooceanicola sediminis]|uniref:XRE family transcriptional regulator n=1 Tax=Pseudooceanicola sediminis TaxID=2211117 RepID=A0A399J2Z9_9RHOB|nr:helix-turn-helix transcriptional regulator [Pseudooceanicola sediminis]KAA2314955.1 helix-turn-helix transcriptional regulator [Puniceibacterium sp. HSS470]RII37326.1 XRE family transcriptional regulator [Pseudooceanicola sediminis]|tara:strand:+ start:6712 stop:7029 length:318 start_codon:yes stop_codon:yes gene_type:complete